MKASEVIAAGVLMLFVGGIGYGFYWDAPTQKAKRYAAERMKDPDSVQFRGLEICKDEYNDVDYVRGEFNAKNGFGAYTGFEQFMVNFIGDEPFGFVTYTGDDDELYRMVSISLDRSLKDLPPLACYELDDAASRQRDGEPDGAADALAAFEAETDSETDAAEAPGDTLLQD